ncbi:MAG: TonB-dependent receptor [Nitrospirota bacterium]|nr:TonB-dependent receptor [Nitrospirota bacterium]
MRGPAECVRVAVGWRWRWSGGRGAVGVLVCLGLSWLVLVLFPGATTVHAQPAPLLLTGNLAGNLMELSLEQLMSIEVVSVARKPQTLSRTPAAVFVITREDIRRSGATSIPEILRMAPGLHVARIDAHSWMVSARGFSDLWTNKLLVLVDGRSVYSPLFSGVFWDEQETLLEDVERIEVIRGPGASVWGANAVNGVINILTRSARDTGGDYIGAAYGTRERGLLEARHGQVDGNGGWRIYARDSRRAGFEDVSGADFAPAQHDTRGGFRIDRGTDADGSWQLQGGAYSGTHGERVQELLLSPPWSAITESDDRVTGGNLMAHWRKAATPTQATELRFWFTQDGRDGVTYRGINRTADLELQQRLAVGERHDLQWGLGYRHNRDSLGWRFRVSFDPEHRTSSLYSAFLQDEITLTPRLRLTLGSKLERNDFTGIEWLPGAHLLWQPADGHSAWLSVTHAAREPARSDSDLHLALAVIPGAPPGVIALVGSESVASEEAVSYQAGYRAQPNPVVAVDVAAFYTTYTDLLAFSAGAPVCQPSGQAPPCLGTDTHVLYPQQFGNGMNGETTGAELAAELFPHPRLKVTGAYSWLVTTLHSKAGNPTDEVQEGYAPTHQATLRISANPGAHISADLWGRYVDRLPTRAIRNYVAVDARLAWQPGEHLEVALVGRDLGPRHQEFVGNRTIVPFEVTPSGHVQVRWWF